MEDIYTQLIDMDTCITEQVVKNADDTYTIFLNSHLSWEQIMVAYFHAVNHIQNEDFNKEHADTIEFSTHDD